MRGGRSPARRTPSQGTQSRPPDDRLVEIQRPAQIASQGHGEQDHTRRAQHGHCGLPEAHEYLTLHIAPLSHSRMVCLMIMPSRRARARAWPHVS
jgi:hypothetical protein